ncbi:MAG: sel1 repeat family protein, partial [Flavobacteriales bacterium]|nr:sel1 repeat family protein [Flavobacteriales bacterium]
NAEANRLIGQIYIGAERGVSDIKRDTKKGIEFLSKALSLGNSEAALDLGNLYYYGNGVKESRKKAEQYWKQSYELGNENAGFALANYYYDHSPENSQRTIEIMKDLIIRNEYKGNCCSKLSKIYASGHGPISPDQKLALFYMEQGAFEGHVHCCMNLGLKYYRGDGVPQDREKAISLVQRVSGNDLFKQEVTVILGKMIKNETI